MAMVDHVEAVKSIPGYKIILTAVLKGQIQQLVEQLSYHSDEEVVLLTANISDGTMTHIGSDSGKGFIHDHEDIKAQFLQFCLEDSHMKQIANSTRKSLSPPVSSFNSQSKKDNKKGVKCHSPKSMSLIQTRTSIGSRHKPYNSKRTRKKLLADTEPFESVLNNSSSDDLCVVKSEPSETSNCRHREENITDPASLEADYEIAENTPSGLLNNYYLKLVSHPPFGDDYKMNDFTGVEQNMDSSIKSVENAELSSLPIDLSEVTKSTSKETKSQLSCDIDNSFLDNAVDNFLVKQEPTVKHYGSDTVGSPTGSKGVTPMRVFACDLCGKPFPSKWELGRHRRTHTGEKPYNCQFCSKAFADKSNMTQHVKSVHFHEPIRKSTHR